MTWLKRTSETFARVADLVRRFVARDTSDPALYEVVGFRDGEDEERDTLEVFGTLGCVARAPADDDTELVAVAVNARDHHVVVAARDVATLRAVVESVGLGSDETVVYTSRAVVKLRADGTVEVRALDGTARPLAYKSDVDAVNARVAALELVFNGHVHSGGTLPGGVTGSTTPAATSATVEGTSVLKGQ